MRALVLALAGLALAGTGCNTDHDTIPERVQSAVTFEATEATSEGVETMLDAIAANDPALTFTGTNPVTVNGTIVVDRTAEGEPPIAVTVVDGTFDTGSRAFSSGMILVETEAHVELGGGTGGHTHGGGEADEEDEPTAPFSVEVPLPSAAGTTLTAISSAGAFPIELEVDATAVP